MNVGLAALTAGHSAQFSIGGSHGGRSPRTDYRQYRPGQGQNHRRDGDGLRAVGNGLKVLMLQFLKGSWHYGELDAVKAFGDNFVMKQMGRGFVKVGGAETDPEDVRLVEEAWAKREGDPFRQWDLVILDEINYAIGYKMLDPQKVVETLRRSRRWFT